MIIIGIKEAEKFYDEALNQALKDNCQSLPVIAKVAINKAQVDMFYRIYEMAEKEPNNERLIEFFDKLDGEFVFEESRS